MTRDYDEEEQGYDSEKEKKEERPTEAVSPKTKEGSAEKGVADLRESKVNGDDHHEEDMDMSDWAPEAGCRRASVSFLMIPNAVCVHLT